MYHDPEHCGINSTTEIINKEFTWRGMQKDIREYIQSCHKCQMVASLPPQPQRKLQPIVPPKQPWYHVGMDLVTDLPTNSLGYKHIIVVVCYLSKFVTARPLFTKTTKSVLEALTDIYLTYGVPKIVQHDQGRVYKQRV